MTTEAEPYGDALVGTVLAERYRIEAVIGHGGMGTVYRAEHVAMKKTVALKVLHPEIASIGESAARFEREAVAAARIEHPNVARATDFGSLPDGSFYLVMEHIDGESLAELIRRGPVEPTRALEIVRQIAGAVQAAHRVGVVHRDLKPANIMIANGETSAGLIKVLDFGVAKLSMLAPGDGSMLTRHGELVGTPEYMAPEQAGGGKVDHRVDLYALGVILHELLSGHPPFSGEDHVAIVAKHFVEPPPELPDGVPETTRALVRALLEKEPDARIQTAADLVSRIDEARAETAPPPSEATAEVLSESIASATASKPPAPAKRRLGVVLGAAAVVTLFVIAAGVVRGSAANRSPTVAAPAETALPAALSASLEPSPAATSAPPTEQEPASAAAQPSAAASSTGEATPSTSQARTVRTRSPKAVPTVTTTALPKGKRIVIRRRVIRRTTITRR